MLNPSAGKQETKASLLMEFYSRGFPPEKLLPQGQLPLKGKQNAAQMLTLFLPNLPTR